MTTSTAAPGPLRVAVSRQAGRADTFTILPSAFPALWSLAVAPDAMS
jgi:hypothetical protein